MIWATVTSRSCFCWLNRASPSSATKNIISLTSVLTVMSVYRVVSCFVERKCLLWPVHFSSQNSVRLCSTSFCIPRPNLPVTPGVWLPTFAFQSPIMKRISFGGVSSKGLVGLHRTVQLQLLQHYWLGHRLGLLWYWMVFLGKKQSSFCLFETAPKNCISDAFVYYEGYFISSKGFLLRVVDITVIWVKFTHSSPFKFTDS